MKADDLRGGYVSCTECGTSVRATRAVGPSGMWPMHIFCFFDRQDDEGAGAHAAAGTLTVMFTEIIEAQE